MSDFTLVLTVVGALIVAGLALIVLEYRGFKAQYQGDPSRTISAYIHNALFRSVPTAAWVGLVVGAAFTHFMGW